MTDFVVPSEAEMAHIRGIFERAANAIVGYSEFGLKLAELQSQVDMLRRDLERVKEHNRWLEEQLMATRHERDEYKQQLAQAQATLTVTETNVAKLKDVIGGYEVTIAKHTDTISRLERESDDHLTRAIKAETELAAVKAKLEEAFEWVKEAHSFFEPKVEEPKAEEPPPTYPALVGGEYRY